MASDIPLRVEETDSEGRPVRRSPARRALAWIGRHPILLSAAIAVLALLARGLHWWYWPNHPTLSADTVESITVRLGKYEPNPGFGPGYEQMRSEVTIGDRDLMQPLLDAFRTATRGEQHNCGNSGVILIRRKDGTDDEVFILPGHDERYYEYRLDSRICRVDREPFLAALKALGLDGIKTVPPS